ncbi:unnamed protein product [Calicophoron daubneyi]|uniref:Uncharacterized protein n=1 Tax=Calicophoron daubneyi TaxID=300641 RepID=A0AAV2SYS4_CALDB
MSRGRGLSRHALYRLRKKRTRETAARIQYFRERLLDIQRRRTSDPEIVTNADTSELPSVQSVDDREMDVNQRTTGGVGAISTTNMMTVLQRWYQDSLPTASQLQNLMHYLRQFLPDLPRDHRTLVNTPRTSPVVKLLDGECVHFDMRQSLTYFLENNYHHKIYVQFNIDGLSLFDSSPCSLWPIQCQIVKPVRSSPFLIGAFYGNSKPKSLNSFLDPFINSLNDCILHVVFPAIDSVDAGLNLSTTENAAPGQPNTGCESILQAIYSLDKKMTNYCSDIVSRLENLQLHVTALDTQVNNYHCDTLRSTGNQEPKPPRWQPWFPLRTIAELQAMEINLQNENCRADVVSWIWIFLHILGHVCSNNALFQY